VWRFKKALPKFALAYLERKLQGNKHVDDFLEVLRWSKEFGVDTPDGREIKQGVIGVFAASAFNPKETVQLKDDSK